MTTMPVSNFTPLTQTVVNGDLERFQEAHLVQTSSSSACSGQPDSVATAANSIRSFVSHQQQRLRQRSAPPAAPRAVAGSDQDSELDEIARQIADHAEALYQTWRARGLTAEDRLLCPANTASLNSVAAENLARRLRRTTSPAAPPSPAAAAPLSNTNLRTSISPLSDAVTRTRLEDSKKSGNPVHERNIPIQLDTEAHGAPRLNGTHTKRAFSVDPQDPIPQARESLQKLVKSFVEEDKARRLGFVTRQTGDITADSSAARHNTTVVNSAAIDHSNSDKSGSAARCVSSSRDAVATAPAVASHTSRLQVTTNGQTRIVQNGEYHIPPAVSVAQTSTDMFSNDSMKTAIRCPADGGNSIATKDRDMSPSSVADEVRRHETRLRSSSLVAAAANNSPAMSTVDYAKRRLQEPPGPSLAAQRLTDARVMTSMATAGSVAGCSVQETRSRYDHGQVNISDTQWRTDWLTADHDDMERCAPRIAAVHTASGAAEPIWRRKKSADPQHLQQQQARVTSPLPHPQLTAEQKQHIRQRSLTPYSAAGVAVRPFLTRGSVAERVLIFERCPVDLKTTERAVPPSVSAGGAALQALSAWRGPNDVRDKTQQPCARREQTTASRVSSPPPPAASTTTGVSHQSADSSASVAAPASASVASAAAAAASAAAPAAASVAGSSGHSLSRTSCGYSASAVPTSPPSPPLLQRPGGAGLRHTTPPAKQAAAAEAATVRSRSRSSAAASNNNNYTSLSIPRFYYPNGRPTSRDNQEAQLGLVTRAFAGRTAVSRQEFGAIAQACNVPRYWQLPLFQAVDTDCSGHVTCAAFVHFWKRVVSTCHDAASRFVHILTSGQRAFLLPEDFVPLLQDVVESHPGLNFLKEAVEFHSRYIHTVIARIFYCVNRSWSGRITAAELRRSNLLPVIESLQRQDDINQITDYFSYEHFYVIYCKFWELDSDHDLLIDRADLSRHNDHAVSTRVIDRVFSGAVTRGDTSASGGVRCQHAKMSYTEFVWFLLSEEDKRHPTSIEYWFRCMDLDGDGFISLYEMEYFYEEQLQRLDSLGIDALPFEDCVCWMLDVVRPQHKSRVSLRDLKRCHLANVFFDTFCNLEKYMEHDQRDPFALQREREDGKQVSDWERYAAEEYELLVAEESAAEPDGCEEAEDYTALGSLAYDDDGDDDEEKPEAERHTLVDCNSNETELTKLSPLDGSTFPTDGRACDQITDLVNGDQTIVH